MRLLAENIDIGYDRDKIVFPNISFTASEGQMIALLGVNGIGKSTLLRTLSGLQKSIKGAPQIDGRSVESLSAGERARLISLVLTEKLFVDQITVREFISLGRSPYTNWLGKLSEQDLQEIEKVIEVMKIGKLQHKLFNQLSDGEKQKVLISRALCQQTPVLILDEPAAFLDFRNKKDILELLSLICRELKKIIILSTHDIESTLAHCSKCWLMTENHEFIEIERSEDFKDKVMKILLAGA